MQANKHINQFMRSSIPCTKTGIKAIRVSKDTYDIFVGNGWKLRSRYRLSGVKQQFLSGLRLTSDQLKEVGAALP